MKIIPISGEIGWEVMAYEVRSLLSDAGGEEIEVHLSSPGGYIYEGLEIFNLIKNYAGKVTVRIVGMAASMASYIALAGDKVVAESNAIFMIHNARAYTGGDQNAHTKVAKILTGMSNLLAQEYIAKTGKDKKEIKSLMDAETYFMGGQEILNAGFADEVVDVGDELDAAAMEELQLDAMLRFESLDKKLQEQPEKFENITKAAAFLPRPQAQTKPGQPVNHNPIQEGNMSFHALMEQHPEAQAEIEKWLAEVIKGYVSREDHEQALEDARTAVETGKLTKEQVNFVGKVISSDAYGASIKTAGIKVLSGEKDFSNYEDLVALADEQNEKFKSLKTQQNQPGGTPADGTPEGEAKKAEAKNHAKEVANRYKGGE